MLQALRRRSIALLWSGQALSSVGDEIYRVAFLWIAVGLIGENTGYVAAGQAAALLLFTLLGGAWADRWDHARTTIAVDVLRGLVVLVPVVYAQFRPVGLPLLVLVGLVVTSLSAFFNPALQALVPRIAPDPDLMQATTGLMATTIRLARVVGPSLIGLMTPIIPTLQFFTIDAITFGVSALSISMLARGLPPVSEPSTQLPSPTLKESIVSGFATLAGSPAMKYVIFAKGVNGGAWALAYGLGLPLLARALMPGSARAFGLIVAAYGIGNLAGALVLGNLRRERPTRLMFVGYVWMGLGFIALGLAPSLPTLMLAAAIAAVGGPMNDLPFLDIIQMRYAIADTAKLFRLRMVVETAATLGAMALSPMLFRALSVPVAIAGCGGLTALIGGYGLHRYGER